MALARKGKDDRWRVQGAVGGGSTDGELRLQTGERGQLQLSGTLQQRNIDIASAVQSFGRRPIVAGKLSGDTRLSASGNGPGEIVRSLRTDTAFTVDRSTPSAGRLTPGTRRRVWLSATPD